MLKMEEIKEVTLENSETNQELTLGGYFKPVLERLCACAERYVCLGGGEGKSILVIFSNMLSIYCQIKCPQILCLT
jgi:hypothetical protein